MVFLIICFLSLIKFFIKRNTFVGMIALGYITDELWDVEDVQ